MRMVRTWTSLLSCELGWEGKMGERNNLCQKFRYLGGNVPTRPRTNTPQSDSRKITLPFKPLPAYKYFLSSIVALRFFSRLTKMPGHALIVDIPCLTVEKAKRVCLRSWSDWQQFIEVIDPIIKDSLNNEPKTTTYHWSLPVGGDEKTYKGLELYPSCCSLNWL